ncbi:acyl-homoserine-lactone synthase [Hyphomicrobium sp.]|uniref:acyl-homoserine-lactone synthase n=1 Tax=Hyphomicrobium sp. TaxID=82 RepID=UPI0025B91778|nr:acyl-homoserine-lactone synthase [Hyphomicrobium sp.]MCC7253546.1 GNAT family N-acetyltransferase [Hyphomicrobium sp.]
MIEAFSLRTAHYFGDALASQACLRYRVFVKQRGLAHSAFEGMEYDEFDTPGAVYLTWRDEQQVVRGLIRLLPTTLPYMVQNYWPHLFADAPLPCSRSVWEATRLCVDRTYTSPQRVRIMPEILCALQEYCSAHGITSVIGVTRKHLLEHFLRTGVHWLGPVDIVEGKEEAAFSVPATHLRPEHHCRKLGIEGSVLRLMPDPDRRAA